MSKASKKRSAEKRRQQKQQKKQAKKALYESFRKQGINSKSKRYQKRSARRLISGVSHPDGAKCGNPGCKKCYDVFFDPFLRQGKPYRMPHWMYLRWSAR